MPNLKLAACLSIAIGMGWTFAEIRRFLFHTRAFCEEAIDDHRDNRVISLIAGFFFLFAGAFLAFHVFNLGAPIIGWEFPYVAGGPESQRFLIVFGSFLFVWVVFSGISTRLIPPPLFPESVANFLCRLVRTGLFLLWVTVVVLALPRIGDKWVADGVGILCAIVAFAGIYTGELWNHRYIGNWPVPPVTCIDRPFPFAATVLVTTGFAYALAVA